MSLSYQIAVCFFATLFFAMLFNQPPRFILVSALVGTAGYTVFVLLRQSTLAYFFSALAIGIASEILARLLKSTATQLITCSMIPIIPGLGLYRTVRFLTENEYSMAAHTGIETVLGICAIALALTFSTLLFKRTAHPHAEDLHIVHRRQS